MVAAAVIAVVALALSVLLVRDTAEHVALEQSQQSDATEPPPPLRRAFPDATWRRPALRACSQAGLINNLNDALAWGLVPLFLAANGASVAQIGLIAGLYPAVWGLGQIWTGHWSDRVGRKLPIVAGMLAASRGARRAGRLRGRRSRSPPPPRSCSASAPRSCTRR